MDTTDRVTVICIAFNHEKWVEKALVSVLLQDYPHKDLIIVENGSVDNTPLIIRKWVASHAEKISIQVIYKSESEPYCQVFNEALDMVESSFVIDLSGDDFLYSSHLSCSIDKLKQVPDAAFVFSDAKILDEGGEENSFYSSEDCKELKENGLSDLYEILIRRSYISAPTVVFNAVILKSVGGYDATLSYEDFDIQLRLARDYPVLFSDHVGVMKRKHSSSLSESQYQRYQSQMLPSTLRVCEKIRKMNRNSGENAALSARVLYELKHALWSANFQVAEGFVKLAKELDVKGIEIRFYKLWFFLRLDISWLYVRLT